MKRYYYTIVFLACIKMNVSNLFPLLGNVNKNFNVFFSSSIIPCKNLYTLRVNFYPITVFIFLLKAGEKRID